MNDHTYTLAHACAGASLPISTVRNWRAHSRINLGISLPNKTLRFSRKEVKILALMRCLVDHGFSPANAALKAGNLVDRARDLDLTGLFSHDPGITACAVPNQYVIPEHSNAFVVIPLGPIWADVDERLAKFPSRAKA